MKLKCYLCEYIGKSHKGMAIHLNSKHNVQPRLYDNYEVLEL